MNAEQTLQHAYNLKNVLPENGFDDLNYIIEYLQKEIFEKTLPSHSEKKTYAATQKLLKRMAKDPRQILGYTKKIKMDEKTYQSFTDTHQAYFLNKIYEQLPNADTDGKSIGTYPDLTQVFPKCDPSYGCVTLHKKEVSDFVKTVDKSTLEKKDVIPYEITFSDNYKACANAKYLLTAFDILGDTLTVYRNPRRFMLDISTSVGYGIICEIRHY